MFNISVQKTYTARYLNFHFNHSFSAKQGIISFEMKLLKRDLLRIVYPADRITKTLKECQIRQSPDVGLPCLFVGQSVLPEAPGSVVVGKGGFY